MNQINSIDLGLSVLWADRNIGAASPWDSGDYFAWGETAPKDDFSWENYKYTEADAATAILGGVGVFRPSTISRSWSKIATAVGTRIINAEFSGAKLMA